MAGGRATRLGGLDKYLLEIGERKVIDHIRGAIASDVDRLVLNCNKPDDITHSDIKIIPDLKYHDGPIGPMGGLQAVLQYAKQQGYQTVVTVPGDTPFIPDDFVTKLMENHISMITIACSKGRKHPLCALWNVGVLEDLNIRINSENYKMLDWIDQQNVTFVEWMDDPDPFFNINTESDLEVAEQLCRSR